MKKYALSLLLVGLLLTGCDIIGGERVRGSGNITSQDRAITGFSGIRSSGFFDVYLASGPSQGVRIEADDNLHSYIETGPTFP